MATQKGSSAGVLGQPVAQTIPHTSFLVHDSVGVSSEFLYSTALVM